ncbi:2-keto-4-pentenoate hydratase [Ureibacillus sp. NPDC094379]
MPTKATVVEQAYSYLKEAEANHESIRPLTELIENFTIEDAYNTQLTIIDDKVSSGAKIVGKKIGLTSYAMQNLLGVDQPDYGHLLDNMESKDKGEVSISSLFQPKVEGEIAFVLKEDLIGPNVTVDQVLNATAYVVPALEIVDSRIQDWNIKLADTVADNASCGLFVIGPNKISPTIDLPSIQMQLLRNGKVVNKGMGSDVLGSPANCVAWLANTLFDYGVTLKKGEVILSGALTAAVAIEPGDTFTAKFTELGEVSVCFVK